MPSYIEEISLQRFEDRIVVSYRHNYKDKHDSIVGIYNESSVYRTGKLESEDVESSYIGALKHFFNESEVWNDE